MSKEQPKAPIGDCFDKWMDDFDDTFRDDEQQEYDHNNSEEENDNK